MSRPTLLRSFAIAVGLALLALLVHGLGLDRLVTAVRDASIPLLLAFAAASTLAFTLHALRARVVLRGLRLPIDPPLATLLGFRAAAHAASFLLPSAQLAGEPLRALLLRRAGSDWGGAALLVAADRGMEASAGAIAGPIYLASFLLASDLSPALAAGSIAAWAIGSVALLAVYAIAARRGRLLSVLLRGRKLAPAAAALGELEQRFSRFVRTRSFAVALALALLAEATIVLEFVLLFDAFALDLPLPIVLGVLLGMGLAHLAPVPIGLGSLEGAQVGVATLAGRAAALGLAIGLLVRLRETIWAAIGLAYLWKTGIGLGAAEHPVD